jgi:TfoX/Sxy family transcriptional regulator of competence genes
MAPSADFLAFLTDQLHGLGTITTRRMFSGAGLYCDGLIFALILRDTLYFKVDDGNRQAYEAEWLEPFTYEASGTVASGPTAGPRAAVRRARRDARLGAAALAAARARPRRRSRKQKAIAPARDAGHLPLPVAKAPKLRHRSDSVVFRPVRVNAMRQAIGTLVLVPILNALIAFAATDIAAQTPKRGGTLNFAVVASPPSYDCHAETTFGMIHPVTPHYSLLLKIDAAHYPDVAGDLAESWSAAPDGMAYTFKLHRGEIPRRLAADICRRQGNLRAHHPSAGGRHSAKSYYEDGAIETPDDHTIVFKMKGPVAGVLELLASLLNCAHSAARLKSSANYPAREIMGSGARARGARARLPLQASASRAISSPAGPISTASRPIVKSTAVIPGLLGSLMPSSAGTPPERTFYRKARRQGCCP